VNNLVREIELLALLNIEGYGRVANPANEPGDAASTGIQLKENPMGLIFAYFEASVKLSFERTSDRRFTYKRCRLVEGSNAGTAGLLGLNLHLSRIEQRLWIFSEAP
jgi:hypothetical protein